MPSFYHKQQKTSDRNPRFLFLLLEPSFRENSGKRFSEYRRLSGTLFTTSSRKRDPIVARKTSLIASHIERQKKRLPPAAGCISRQQTSLSLFAEHFGKAMLIPKCNLWLEISIRFAKTQSAYFIPQAFMACAPFLFVNLLFVCFYSNNNLILAKNSAYVNIFCSQLCCIYFNNRIFTSVKY